MALSSTVLNAAINARISSELNIDLSEQKDPILNIITDEILKHIVENGVITTTVNTTGTAAAQTGTGAGGIS